MTTPTISTAEDRAQRLTEAGQAWGERITADTANAKVVYATSGRGTGAVASEITSGKHTFTIDEPAALAGDDAAASPVEYALGALISCQIVVYRLYAQQLGIEVDEIEIEAEGDLDVRGLFGVDDSVRPGFSAIRLVTSVTGPETQERYDELLATVDARCPVLDLFSNPTPVSTSIRKR